MLNFGMDFQFPEGEMRKIMRDINRGLVFDIRSKLLKVIPHLEKILPIEIHRRIQNSDVINAITYGTLRYDLGLTTEEAMVISQQIPDVISKLIEVKVSVTGENSISFIVELIKNAYEDILDLPAASFIQTHTTNSQTKINWLEWLLKEGNNIIIGDFRVKYTPGNANSRSGGAIMIKKGSFRIAPEYSGTIDNNFITRALEGVEDFIYMEIQNFLNI